MAGLGLSGVQAIRIEEDFSPQSQWTWFQEIVQHIGQGDFLIVDLTHGYRAMSIVFSNAINFVRRVVLEGVYYGAFESDREASPIVDGLIGVPDAAIHTSKGRSQRQKADVFIQMLQFPEARWNFSNDKLRMCESLIPHHQRLRAMGALERIQAFLPDLVKYPNGMGHAWTSQKDTPEDLLEKPLLSLKALKDVVDLLTDQGVLAK